MRTVLEHPLREPYLLLEAELLFSHREVYRTLVGAAILLLLENGRSGDGEQARDSSALLHVY